MSTSNILEAKTHLSHLVDQACQGEEVIIARKGRPLVRLVPIPPMVREPGEFRGRISGDITGPIGSDDEAWG